MENALIASFILLTDPGLPYITNAQ